MCGLGGVGAEAAGLGRTRFLFLCLEGESLFECCRLKERRTRAAAFELEIKKANKHTMHGQICFSFIDSVSDIASFCPLALPRYAHTQIDARLPPPPHFPTPTIKRLLPPPQSPWPPPAASPV
jgi:hypothetical protein